MVSRLFADGEWSKIVVGQNRLASSGEMTRGALVHTRTAFVLR
jgi:hypothetical protein